MSALGDEPLIMTVLGRFLFVAIVLLMPACGGSSTSPSSINLSGSWTGNASDSSGPANISATLSQSAGSVTGTVRFSVPNSSVVGNGTFSGTLSGTTLTFTTTIPVGGFSGFLVGSCSATLSGTANVATITISGVTATQIVGTYSGNNSCSGPFTNGTISMTKQ
jgi:hypothetical protein